MEITFQGTSPITYQDALNKTIYAARIKVECMFKDIMT